MSNHDEPLVTSNDRGGFKIHITPAVIALVVSGGFLGGERIYSRQSHEVVPAQVLREVQSLRNEEMRRMAGMERQISAIGNKVQVLEAFVYGRSDRRTELGITVPLIEED